MSGFPTLIAILLAALWVGLILSPATNCAEGDVLVQVQVLSRHCDRTCVRPDLIFPKCPVDLFKKLHLNAGDLTALGEYQCHSLGAFLSRRYFGPKSLLGGPFNGTKHVFHSTAINRALRSAWSLSMGLFPAGGSKIDVPPFVYSLPSHTQSIPVHSHEIINDRTLVEGNMCPAWTQYHIREIHSERVKEWKARRQADMDVLLESVGWDPGSMDALSIAMIQDPAVVLLDHLALCEGIEPHVPLMQDILSEMIQLMYDRNHTKKLIGGGFAMKLLEGFRASEKDGSPTFIHWSAHDSSIMATMYGLFLFEDYPEFYHQPPFGSALIFELWRTTTDSYYVRVLFKEGYMKNVTPDEPRVLRLASLGCVDVKCDLDVLEGLLMEKTILLDKEWCAACNNTVSDVCLRRS